MPEVSQNPQSAQVSFGSASLPEDEKSARVQALFDRVARRYDLMNDLMSFRLHRVWRQSLIAHLAPRPSEHLLDAAGGTGDIAMRFLLRGGGKATVTDISPAMLEIGRKRALDNGLARTTTFRQDDMENSSLPDEQFQCATCAFGLRNATHPQQALAQIYRTLQFGGRFLALEFCPTPFRALPPLAALYDTWILRVVPALGKRVAHDEAAYRYLVESVRRFASPSALNAMLERAGFVHCAYRPLSGGIVALHWGWKA